MARALRRSIAAAVGVLTAGVVYVAGGAAREPEPPAPPTRFDPGFRVELVADGLTLPTAFDVLPDGRILVAEKRGTIRLIENGRATATPVLDIRAKVNDYYERGLLGLAVDPRFERNHHVYVLYTVETDPTDRSGPKSGRLARYTLNGNRADVQSELVLLGRTVGAGCASFPPGSDCIPEDWNSHAGGDLEFASDGSLFVGLGDGASWEQATPMALRAQRLDVLAGKILRITPTGAGLASNPFFNGDPSASRSKVWAYGLRNPFRFGLVPGRDLPVVGDVGWTLAEEISIAGPGDNLGWPCYEGRFRTPGYEAMPACRTLYSTPDAARAPLVAWGPGTAIGGTFYEGLRYPRFLRGAYVYADWRIGVLRYLRLRPGAPPEGPFDLGPASSPVDIELGADGYLYFLSLAPGALWRLVYSG